MLIVLLALASASFAYGQSNTAAARGNGDEQWIRDLERRLGDAITRMDRTEVSKLLAYDFISTGSNAEVSDKAQTIASLTPYPDVKISFAIDDINVRLYQGTTAVVTGRDTLKLETKEKSTTITFRFTRVYIKRDGRWQVVAQQVTTIPQGRE
jgi:hypothetical protein